MINAMNLMLNTDEKIKPFHSQFKATEEHLIIYYLTGLTAA